MREIGEADRRVSVLDTSAMTPDQVVESASALILAWTEDLQEWMALRTATPTLTSDASSSKTGCEMPASHGVLQASSAGAQSSKRRSQLGLGGGRAVLLTAVRGSAGHSRPGRNRYTHLASANDPPSASQG